MTRLLTLTMALALLGACGDDERRPAEVARADEALVPLEDSASNEVTPAEEPIVPSARPAPATRPAARPRPRPAPRSVPTPAVDTTPPAPAAEVAADSVAPSTPAADTTTPLPEADTAPPTPIPAPARAPDTVGTARPIPAPRPPVVPETSHEPASMAVPVGAELHAALVDSIHSRRDSVGRTVTAKLMDNVPAPDGRTLLPAGATVRLTVMRLAPAGSRSASDGRLELSVDDITVNGKRVEVAADVRPIPHELRGRGVTGSEAAKVGAGAAAGAIAGRVLGGDAKGAVIGGVVGAAGGAAVATQTADRDVVVKAGTPVTFVLTAPLVPPAP